RTTADGNLGCTFFIQTGADGTDWAIWESWSDGSTVQGNNGPYGSSTVSSGDVFRLEAQSTTLRAYQNSTLLGAMTLHGTQTAPGNSGTAGFGIYPNVGTIPPAENRVAISNFTVGTWAGPSISFDKPLWYFGPGNNPPSSFNLGAVAVTLTAS